MFTSWAVLKAGPRSETYSKCYICFGFSALHPLTVSLSCSNTTYDSVLRGMWKHSLRIMTTLWVAFNYTRGGYHHFQAVGCWACLCALEHARLQVSQSLCMCASTCKSPSTAESICVFCLSMSRYLNTNSLSAACTGLQMEQTTKRCSARWQQPLGEWCNTEKKGKERRGVTRAKQKNPKHTRARTHKNTDWATQKSQHSGLDCVTDQLVVKCETCF